MHRTYGTAPERLRLAELRFPLFPANFRRHMRSAGFVSFAIANPDPVGTLYTQYYPLPNIPGGTEI